MFNFFDFIFYQTYKKYIDWGEKDVPGVYALCVVTLFPCLNISSLIFLGISILKVQSWNYDKLLLLLSFLMVLALNYYRIYKVNGLSNLLNKWQGVEPKRKRWLTGWMFVYFVLSIVVLFVSIIY